MKLLLPVCTLFAVLQLTTSASIRGVPPSLHRVYDASSDAFKCLDGSKSLPWSRINDDYCDCVDGSDEPGKRELNFLVRQLAARTLTFDCRLHARPKTVFAGTSACSNGRFYCRNRGHQPLIINASFVDDGICGMLLVQCCCLTFTVTDAMQPCL